jgi:hypothetical protein
MFGGLLAGHILGYRLAFGDPHARADALAQSGHSYFRFVPLALAVSLTVLVVGLTLQAFAGFRGRPRRAAASPLIVLLPPLAFVTQEVIERAAHMGGIPWTLPLQPAFLFGLALQLPSSPSPSAWPPLRARPASHGVTGNGRRPFASRS